MRNIQADGDNAIVRWRQCVSTMATIRKYDDVNATVLSRTPLGAILPISDSVGSR
ncbi:hypothetical protein DPMN_026484 [Dreissena polymorpha]|uniref:Uncharacterized protein n=1 Tax=Dreissena polymorpha TaxID=45954 RepID=A0A9D4LR83_DREPO|nr:hypothetical protein DPMN_026484 [Dreissena polymorpha]